MSGFLTVREVAARLRISLSGVYQLCGEGRLPHVRLGLWRGTIRVRKGDLAEVVEGCRIDGGRPTNAAGLKHIRPAAARPPSRRPAAGAPASPGGAGSAS